ncbi:sensor histidine kinase [Spirosoma radiotolerans]|uniref:sensor histidine kinase n=1 Tax=Spirosoma radiotolerans TaxID=1379870 RepID=UPI0006987DDD|nr:ATP-binding protein [Spirosoma radiotolerans]
MNDLSLPTFSLPELLDYAPYGLAYFEPIWVSQTITDFNLMRANTPAQAWLALTSGREPWVSLKDGFPGALEDGLLDRLVTVFLTKTVIQFEHHDGSARHWARWSLRPLGTGLLVSFENLTQGKIEQQLEARQQAELLLSVLDASPAIVVAYELILDPTGVVTDLRYVLQNHAHRQAIGMTDEEVIGQTMLTLFPSLRDSNLLTLYTQVAQTGQPFRGEHLFPDGYWYDVSAIKRGDGVVVTATNIHAQKTAQQQMAVYQSQLEAANQELKQANRQLQQTNQNLHQLTYSVSHDLQEPLRKIQTFSDLLQVRYQSYLPQPAQADLQRLQLSAARMSVLIRDIRTYSGVVANTEAFRTVSLSAVVRQVARALAQPVASSGAILSIGELPRVVGAADQLQQLFYNLLSNALTFTRPGVTPDLSVTAHSLEPHEVPLLLQGLTTVNWWEIRVQDNGPGFEEKYLDRIFSLFQQLQGKSRHEGSGLGLALCKRVLDNHGGAITARSQPGQGATFIIYLPAS